MLDFNPGNLFVSDYKHARADFLTHCDGLSFEAYELQSYTVVEDFHADALYFGSAHARRVLVLISGTHGVEGYAGSAIQRFLLPLFYEDVLHLPDDMAVVMIHSLNPWGMYWARRCDQDGIDLNRNFCDFSQLPPLDADARQVVDALQLATTEATVNALHRLNDSWGQERFDKAFSEGQYQIPWAPFYGGQQAAASQRVIDDVIQRWQLDACELLVIDLHTGLGPWGYGELISDHPAGSTANQYARRIFSQAVAVTGEGQSFSVPKRGLLDYRWHPLMTGSGCFLTLEFGTFGTDKLFYTLLDEHRFWREHTPHTAPGRYAAQRQAMLQHFCPEDYLWQQGVLFRSWQVVRRLTEVAS